MDEILSLGSWHWRDEYGKLVMIGPNKSDNFFRARIAVTYAIFDTIPDDRKQVLRKKTPQKKLEEKKCPVCGKQDTQKHRYLSIR
jgi:hypothetical protein